MNRTANLARIALVDTTVIATLADTALTNLDHGLNGWPTTTPGASPATSDGTHECPHKDCNNTTPCPLHDPDSTVHLTTTERLTLTVDKARTDLEALQHHTRQLAHHASHAARIAHRWGLAGITDTEIKAGLEERLNEIWCKNCAKAGISTVHRIGRTECAFCEQFRLTGACGLNNPNSFTAPKPLLDIRFTRGHVNSADVIRTMTATYGPNWNIKIPKKGKKKAA